MANRDAYGDSDDDCSRPARSPYFLSTKPPTSSQNDRYEEFREESSGATASKSTDTPLHSTATSTSQTKRSSFDLTQKKTFGVILLGNTGAGKSFLLNALLGCDLFASRVSATSITRDVNVATEVFDIAAGESYDVKLLDIPGLIESSQDQIDDNKQKIYQAFKMQPLSIVGFVFKVFGNGRLNNDDVVAFKAIVKAYALEQKLDSLCFIINGIPRRSAPAYIGEILLQLEKLTGMRNKSTCFLKDVDLDDAEERKALRTELIVGLLRCNAEQQKKRHKIELEADQIGILVQQMEELNRQWRTELQSLNAEAARRELQYAVETENLRKQLAQAQQDNVKAQDFKREHCIQSRTKWRRTKIETDRS